MSARVCSGCGCTDDRPCVDGQGFVCAWVNQPPGEDRDWCSACEGVWYAPAVLGRELPPP